ncbi:MAG: hypothetical protein QNJ26_07975 [Desulfobacterales bacterium]|nr:hypothetical protein [Desulfobacterales bacterium]
MGREEFKAKKMKIKLKAKDGKVEYVQGDNQPVPDLDKPDISPAEIEERLNGLGNLKYVGAIFHSHSSPG